MRKIKTIVIKIRNWKTGKVIFSYKCKANTIAKTIRKAVNLGVDLSYADLSMASIKDVNLEGAKLSHSNLFGANLSNTRLVNADLSYANLMESCLFNCDFSNANLLCADFKYAYYLDIANVDSTILNGVKGINDECPKEGSFIGWKKCYNKLGRYIVKLEIPEDAKRSSGTSKKCRCSKAKVLDIQHINMLRPSLFTKYILKCVHSWYDKNFKYKIGDIVEIPDFDERYWKECASGIHFFMCRKDACEY